MAFTAFAPYACEKSLVYAPKNIDIENVKAFI